MKTIVYQSQAPSKLGGWMQRCCESVQAWAYDMDAEYRFLDDELFGYAERALQEKFANQPVILSDVARLRLMQSGLAEGYDRVIWCDADLLIFRPESLRLGTMPHAVGREVWVQWSADKLKSYRKVHNAFLMATSEDSFLPFYADSAEALLTAAEGPLVPQFIGPKYLTAQHNIRALHVQEDVGMLSPLALADIVREGGDALRRMLEGHPQGLNAVNLCASYESRESDGVCNGTEDYHGAIDYLLAAGLSGLH